MRPTTSTQLVAAYEALSGALASVMEPIGVQTLDGPRVAQELEADVLLVGYSPDSAATLDRARAGLGERINESIEVRCLFSTVSGDTDLAPRRARVQQVLDVVGALCALERPLAGVVDRLDFGESMDLQQAQTEDGSVAELSFSLVGRILR